jgi:hypothetical protein
MLIHGWKLNPALEDGRPRPEVGTTHREDLANAGELWLGGSGRGQAEKGLSYLAQLILRDNAEHAAGSSRRSRGNEVKGRTLRAKTRNWQTL